MKPWREVPRCWGCMLLAAICWLLNFALWGVLLFIMVAGFKLGAT